MEILLHVLTDDLDIAVWSLSDLVNDQVRIVFTEVMEEDRDPETYRALQVALAVSGADEESRDVVVVTDLRPLWIVFLERVAANVTLSRIVIFFLFLTTNAVHWSICPKLLDDRRLPLDEYVQELGERILADLRHRQLIVSAESRAENGGRGAHFVLWGVSCLLRLVSERVEDGLEVLIDHEWCHGAKLVVEEFEFRLFEARRWKHMEHRNEVVSGAELLITRENIFR